MNSEIYRSNNVGMIKIIAAILVIVSHAFPLSVVDGEDVLLKITNGFLSLGGVPVATFFFLSGLLVTHSLLRKPDLSSYFERRVERIFPPLFLVVVLCAFALGPFLTVVGMASYFTDPATYLYLLNGVCILRHNLPGVFAGNAYGSVVNGALWTLPLEVAGYIVIALAYRLKLLNVKAFIITSVIVYGGWFLVILSNTEALIIASYQACMMFCFGMLARILWDGIRFNAGLLVISVLALIFGAPTAVFPFLFVILFPYILICLCWKIPQVSARIGRLGDMSYGIYLVGYPIQQTVVYLFGGTMNPFVNILISVPLAVVIGGAVETVSDGILKTIKRAKEPQTYDSVIP